MVINITIKWNKCENIFNAQVDVCSVWDLRNLKFINLVINIGIKCNNIDKIWTFSSYSNRCLICSKQKKP